MRVLVTGGAGYLGSILSRKLLEKGYQVRLIDTFWYGKESIEDLISNKNFEIIEGDIRNLLVTVKALKDVQAVIHLASIVGMPASSIEPKSSEEINILLQKILQNYVSYTILIPIFLRVRVLSMEASLKN